MEQFNQSREEHKRQGSLILIDNDLVAIQHDEKESIFSNAPLTERHRDRKSSKNQFAPNR